MSYSEKYGLVYYRNRLFSDECDVNPKISKEQALAAADKHLDQVKKDEQIGDVLAKGEVKRLVIINPTLIRKEPFVASVPMAELRKTRLAWEIWYENSAKSGEVFPVRILTYIDAITGEPLWHETY